MVDREKAKHVIQAIEGTLDILRRVPSQGMAGPASTATIEGYNTLLALAKEAAPGVAAYRWPAALADGSACYVDAAAALTKLQGVIKDVTGEPAFRTMRITR